MTIYDGMMKTSKRMSNFDVAIHTIKNLMKHIHEHLQPLTTDGSSKM
jgi:hypothetical protein